MFNTQFGRYAKLAFVGNIIYGSTVKPTEIICEKGTSVFTLGKQEH